IEVASRHERRRELCVHEEQPLSRQGGQTPVKGSGIREDRGDVFFERDEDPGLLAFAGGADQRLQREYALPGARSAHDEGGAVTRQSAETDFVESLDACGNFRQKLTSAARCRHHGCSYPISTGCT